MRLHVTTCVEMAAGAATFIEGQDELLFVLAAVSVTAAGARSLQAGWQTFVDRGVWRWTPATVPTQGLGRPSIRARYRLADLPPRRAVSLDFRDGRLTGLLSPDHFDPAIADELTRVAADVAAAGWVWTPRTRRLTAA